MNILCVIVHYWNPAGTGQHQSLRPNPQPKVAALEAQLLSLLRLGLRQSHLHLTDRAVYPCNQQLRHNIDTIIVTDGSHHVLDRLKPPFSSTFEHCVTQPSSPMLLGFAAHQVLADHLRDDYDYYCFLEDDLVIHDAQFFHKLAHFSANTDSLAILVPNRYETRTFPHPVNRFYIDGPISLEDLSLLPRQNQNPYQISAIGIDVAFENPPNPHAGCFFLTQQQLKLWINSTYWMDMDTAFISPLESAATLSVAKAFSIYKTSLQQASWFDIEHHGASFHSLIQA